MTWKEERDALIAQTMAFVQSVTGKPADFSQFELPPVPVRIPIAPRQAAAPREIMSAEPVVAAGTAPDAPHSEPPQQMPARAPEPAIMKEQASAIPEASRPGPALPARFTSIASQLDLQRDMQAEIRARVARFRAHQERFTRERQEYFSSELARLKASAEGTGLPED
ncbi:conserved hypothetical protein [Bradyrhizobium oligotrophicum S58]|uniref:Uncharacterized protein n=1 Tax=Bradyrhizobium oligotrophicum S58 TaxID=1245469 RepID=M4ZAJ4_9BRAD|nr:hypothetical protein [Bradyrhizobium oligotrophicum]BAM90602.1 conserved hypothetical protein [Bradyrhizobium oligotrophicum S58]